MKNTFIKSTLILILGGFIIKIMGMFIKIIITRSIGESGLSLYMLTLPTYNLFITLVTSGMQISTSKLISENRLNKTRLISTSLVITLITSFILVLILVIFAKPITVLLHNDKLYYPILSIILSLPFIGISSILKGYFLGLNKMHVQVISNFFEQLIRIGLYVLVLPSINNKVLGVAFIIGSNMISEIVALITMLIFLPKKISLKKLFKFDKNIKTEILSISVPSTTSRVIGTISYFFEPIILTNLLIINGYSNSYISTEYGIITGYAMQLLLLPSFFSMAISQSIIPLISNAFVNKRYLYIKKKIREIIIISLIIGLTYTIVINIKPIFFLETIYNTNKGTNYIKILSPVFILLYIQTPLTSVLQSINLATESMKATIYGIIIKTILMIVLSFFKFGIYAFIYPMLINIVFVTIHNYIKIKRSINSFL
ncbi:MAG: oligosaccharide flippase family protein [Bacilli bacterium]|nr:oligosaccharide flippase family protein [Bacilli bacterium]